MSGVTLTSPATVAFQNAQQWHDALGGVPLDRIVFDPLPGTATEEDLRRLSEADGRLYELVDGTLVEKPAGLEESFIAGAITRILGTFVSTGKTSASQVDRTITEQETIDGGEVLPGFAARVGEFFE